MLQPVPSPWLADEARARGPLPTNPPADAPAAKALKSQLARRVRDIARRQRMLYADDRFSLLLVFQALDAAGKDGTIRKVLSGVNPAGCQVHSFKAPSKNELDHDFLWRTARSLPERGRIGVFNRSYYEEVLVVRVHPSWLGAQRLPRGIGEVGEPAFWTHRLQSIAEHERHLARNGTVILKFFLNVSKDEQARRLLARIEDPSKNWKFSSSDIDERDHWDAYQRAGRRQGLRPLVRGGHHRAHAAGAAAPLAGAGRLRARWAGYLRGAPEAGARARPGGVGRPDRSAGLAAPPATRRRRWPDRACRARPRS